MILFLILIATSIVAFLVQTILLVYQRDKKYVKNIPSVPFWTMTKFVTFKNSSVDTFNKIEEVIGYHTGMAKFWVGTKLVLFCEDPVNMKTILMSKNCVEKPDYYRFIAGTGDGLFTAHGDRWRADRKHMNTVFTPGILKTFIPKFNAHYARLIRKMGEKVDQPAFDMSYHIFSSNIDIFCDNNLRFDANSEINGREKIINFIIRVWKLAEIRISSVFLHSDFIYRFTKLFDEEQKVLNHLVKITKKVIENSRTFCGTAGTIADGDAAKRIILIEKLMEMKGQGLMTDKLIEDHINTFLVAGTDTSSLTMLSTLLMLAMHPNIQQRVYDEICTHVTDIEHVSYEMLTELEYTERVIKETMRLFPVAQALMRETEADIQLTDCVAPKGTSIVLGILKMHRNKEIWGETANEFDPERFLPEKMAGRHPFAYVPFSAGPRNCIGYKYAMVSMKILLCHLLMAYKLSTTLKMSDIVLKFEIMMRMDNPCLVKLSRRD